MIGYYVHHAGRGHLHHALAIAAQLEEPVTILSSLPRSPDWAGEWVVLDRDDGASPVGVDANGTLHWAPLRHRGLQSRMARLATWIETAAPSVIVVDVSVEVVALARLCGVPVVTFCLPGLRLDRAHRLGWELADTILAPWPDDFPGLCAGLDPHLGKVVFTGAFSRFDGRDAVAAGRHRRHGVLLGGLGGDDRTLVPDAPGWTWTVLGAASWCTDPWPALCTADVVVTHGGLAAVGEVAAARAPAVVFAQPRPYGEQERTVQALGEAGIAVTTQFRDCDPTRLLERARELGGAGWRRWSDLHGAERAARAIERVAAADGVTTCASR